MTTVSISVRHFPMSFRRRSREIALQILFQKEYTPQITAEQALNLYGENFDLDGEVREFAELIINGVLNNQKKIDDTIEGFSKNWKLQRMSLVDRNILRIATFELLFNKENIPPQVAIDEAIEVGKRYGSQDSSSFINGVLDNILKNRDL